MKVRQLAGSSGFKLSLGVVVVFAIFLLVTGVHFGEAVRLLLVLTIQIGAGSYFWARLRHGRADAIEILGMGLVIGPVLSLASTLIVQVLGGGLWGWSIPALVALVIAIAYRKSKPRIPSVPYRFSRSSLLALGVTGVTGLLSLIPNITSYPLRWVGFDGRYHLDMLFFESIGTSIAKFGPLDSIFTPGGSLRYHWLVYGWAGELSSISSASPFVVLTRVVPVIAILAACLIAIAWVRRLTSVIWAPSLAVVLLIFGGYVGATNGVIFNFDSPSQALSASWLLAASFALIILFTDEIQGRRKVAWLVTLIAVLFAATTGGKISAGAVGIAAVCVVALFAIISRPWWWKRAIAAAVFVVGLSGALYVTLISGSASPGDLRFGSILDRASTVQGLNPIPGTVGVLIGTAIMLIAISLRWAGLIWFIKQPATRKTPSVIYGSALAVTGLLAVVFMSSGLNETWFALAASAPLIAISAAGVAEGIRNISHKEMNNRLRLLLAAVTAVVGFVVVSLLWRTGPSGGDPWFGTLRWIGPLAAVVVVVLLSAFVAKLTVKQHLLKTAVLAISLLALVGISAQGRFLGIGSDKVGVLPPLSLEYFGPFLPFVTSLDTTITTQWSDQHVAAADWLKSHAQSDDLLATNFTAGSLVPALTGMRTFASAVIYQAMYGPTSLTDSLLTREREEWAFIDRPSSDTLAPLCEAGVSWIWVDPIRTQTRNWEPFATVVYTNADATILKLNPSTCM
jgi:hypothetical protein